MAGSCGPWWTYVRSGARVGVVKSAPKEIWPSGRVLRATGRREDGTIIEMGLALMLWDQVQREDGRYPDSPALRLKLAIIIRARQ